MSIDQVKELARLISESRYVVVLTGAGASTEAGLPDWRGPQGMWKHWNPTRLASLSAMREHPIDFYQFYRYRLSRLRGVVPGPTQRALATLERAGKLRSIITQNIDGLHQAAGSTDVIEVHGNLENADCVDCGARYSADLLDVEVESLADVPVCASCGGMLKPSIVLFEESLPMEAIRRAFEEAERADLFLVIGSSLEVGPVNEVPAHAHATGAKLVILNMSPTHLDPLATMLVREPAGQVLNDVLEAMGLSSESEEGTGTTGA